MSTNLKITSYEQVDKSDDALNQQTIVDLNTAAIVIVGTGPVGMRLAQDLLSRNISQPVIVYGGEPQHPYNRVRLSDYLAGEVYRDDLTLEECSSDSAIIEYRYNCAITLINKEAQTVTDANGNLQRYSKLVLATGSTPFIPNIGNRHFDGVYTFRTLSEADELMSRKFRTRHTVIIGGGLLGLEAARAMKKYHTEITIVEHNKWVMAQQLDERGGKLLGEFVKDQNMRVITDDRVISFTGNNRVEGVTLKSGIHITCDTVIIAAGIRPNIALAYEAGISCNKGIRVNDQLETSAENIFAIGECAEHKNTVYGLVNPGFEQASLLAYRLTGGKANYLGSISSTKLKVLYQSVFSAGRIGNDEGSKSSVREYIFEDKEAGHYRKIRVFGNRIIGAVVLGEWHESALVNEAIEQKRNIWIWHLLRFKYSGNIWGNADEVDVSTWPATAIVCNCTGVTRGRLSQYVGNGCESVTCLSRMTRAGSVCGSCKPLLAEMLGEKADIKPVRAWHELLALSALTLAVAVLFIFILRIPYPDSVQVGIRWDMLWRDSLFKQISGFVMLGLIAIGLFVSIRKRVSRFSFGDYYLWRISHIVLGISALFVLIAHTGFRIGNELNFLLMVNFLLIVAAGANASTVVATEHRMVPAVAKKQRRLWNKVHLGLFWTLPVLLGFHVLKTYYF